MSRAHLGLIVRLREVKQGVEYRLGTFVHHEVHGSPDGFQHQVISVIHGCDVLFGAAKPDLADSPILSASMAKAIQNLLNGKSMLDEPNLLDVFVPLFHCRVPART